MKINLCLKLSLTSYATLFLLKAAAQCPTVGVDVEAPSCATTATIRLLVAPFDITYYLKNSSGTTISSARCNTQDPYGNGCATLLLASGVGAGTYSIVSDDDCVVSNSVQVQFSSHVVATASISPSRDPLHACENAPFSLTASVSPADRSFSWMKKISDVNQGNWTYASGANGLIYSPSSGIEDGQYKVVVDNPCGAATESEIIQVVRTPPPVVSFNNNIKDSYCKGAVVPLTGATPLGGSWYIDDSPVTGSSVKWQGNFYTKVSYVGTDAYGCSAEAVKQVGTTPLFGVPDVSYMADYNQPLTVTLTPTQVQGYEAQTFKWYAEKNAATSFLTGNSFTTPPLVTRTIYWVAATWVSDNNCEDGRIPLVVNIGGPTNHNYIREDIIQQGNVKTPADVALTSTKKISTISYVDGLGRPLQNVTQQGSPAGKDVVTSFYYDQFGRESIKPLPLTSDTDGRYKDLLNSDGSYKTAINFYRSNLVGIQTDNEPFSKIIFESSPLNRILKTLPPGASAHTGDGDGISKEYAFNGDSEVFLFKYSLENGSILLDERTYYASGTLSRVITTDEDNKQVIEFTDREGRLICKKVRLVYSISNPVYASTYYIYDDFGNLAAVLPPEAVTRLTPQN